MLFADAFLQQVSFVSGLRIRKLVTQQLGDLLEI
jgi:hypothetical protein